MDQENNSRLLRTKAYEIRSGGKILLGKLNFQFLRKGLQLQEFLESNTMEWNQENERRIYFHTER